MPTRSSILTITETVLKVAVFLNFAAFAAFVVALVFTVAAEPRFIAQFPRYVADPQALARWMRVLLLVGMAGCAPAHFVLTRLRDIVLTVRQGSPFSLANAARLRTIAWAMVALQLLNFVFGYAAYRITIDTGFVMNWTVSFTGLLAVLLLFVLAQVFEQGAAMGDELEATV